MIYTKTVHSDELTTQVPLAFREAKRDNDNESERLGVWHKL